MIPDQINFYQELVQWRSNQQTIIKKRYPDDRPLYDHSVHFHTVINNKKNMLITVGDSWTWGDSLDSELRLQQVYGSLLKHELNSDWINIGCPGFSNSFILENLIFLAPLLKSSDYQKIVFVITLTENGRDIKAFPYFRYDYKLLCDKIGICQLFYDTLLKDTETFWIRQIEKFIKQIDSRFEIVIGKNFVWHSTLADKLNDQVKLLELNWIECLAQAQNLHRPLRTNLVTGWVFDSVDSVHDALEVKDRTEFKKWALPYIDRANQVNEWLDISPMNYKKYSKHPNKDGHQVWADYILQNL